MEGAEGSIPIFVLRRFASDYYSINGTYNEVACDIDHGINITYLVHDRLCVAEEELYRKGIINIITPMFSSTAIYSMQFVDRSFIRK